MAIFLYLLTFTDEIKVSTNRKQPTENVNNDK